MSLCGHHPHSSPLSALPRGTLHGSYLSLANTSIGNVFVMIKSWDFPNASTNLMWWISFDLLTKSSCYETPGRLCTLTMWSYELPRSTQVACSPIWLYTYPPFSLAACLFSVWKIVEMSPLWLVPIKCQSSIFHTMVNILLFSEYLSGGHFVWAVSWVNMPVRCTRPPTPRSWRRCSFGKLPWCWWKYLTPRQTVFEIHGWRTRILSKPNK